MTTNMTPTRTPARLMLATFETEEGRREFPTLRLGDETLEDLRGRLTERNRGTLTLTEAE